MLALATLAVLFFVAPLLGLLARAPWSELGQALASPEVRTALRLSAVCSGAATLLSVVLGLPLAWVLARHPFPGRSAVRALATLPMILPPVVGGAALLLAFGRRGLIGQGLYAAFGIRLPFTIWGAILAETFVAMPFLVITAEAAFRAVDQRYEEAARSLGAGPWTAFRRVTLPLAAPALGAGTVLCWARALGEFGATITFAGNFPGRTQTVPLQIYLLIESGGFDQAIALSLVLVGVSLAVLVLLRDRWTSAL